MKAIITGWLDKGEEIKRSVPLICPKCGKKLHRVDISRILGLVYVFCLDNKCRWCESFEA